MPVTWMALFAFAVWDPFGTLDYFFRRASARDRLFDESSSSNLGSTQHSYNQPPRCWRTLQRTPVSAFYARSFYAMARPSLPGRAAFVGDKPASTSLRPVSLLCRSPPRIGTGGKELGVATPCTSPLYQALLARWPRPSTSLPLNEALIARWRPPSPSGSPPRKGGRSAYGRHDMTFNRADVGVLLSSYSQSGSPT